MIRLADAAILALTKLRTRKVRTIVTVVTASLLFSILVFAVAVSGGIIESAKRFTSGDLSERYLVNVQAMNAVDDLYGNSDTQARAVELQTKVVADKKAAAKRLGLEYDPLTEPKPVEENESGKYLNTESLAARQAVAEYHAKQPTPLDATKQLAGKYHPKAYYTFAQSIVDGRMKLMKNNAEDFNEKPANGMAYSPTQDIVNGWYYLDASVVKPFLVDQKYLDAQLNKSDLPIVAPYSKVEAALGLEQLPKTASPKQQLDRINDVRARAATVTFTTCYRNGVSQMQIDEAMRVAKEIEQNKKNQEYQKPSLIYNLPDAGSCASASIKSDTRSLSEKQLASKQLEFNREFGETVDPVQQKVTFRVVGIAPNGYGLESFTSVDGLISMIAGSSLQGMWVVPQDMYDALPNDAKAAYDMFNPASGVATHRIDRPYVGQLVEFEDAASAKAFVSEQGCSGFDCGTGKPFLSYFGSNSVLVQDLADSVTQVLTVAGLIIAGVAALIMMGMVGRVIGDSRRETAVFRAIGARRNDIRAIYTTYTIFLSLLVAAASIVIGVAAALWFNAQFSLATTVRAQLTFVGVEAGQEFHLFSFWWQAILIIICLVVAAGLVSMLLPLARNLARSPIKDMRDDT